MLMCVHVCACRHMEPEADIHGVFFSITFHIIFLFLRQDLSLNPELTDY